MFPQITDQQHLPLSRPLFSLLDDLHCLVSQHHHYPARYCLPLTVILQSYSVEPAPELILVPKDLWEGSRCRSGSQTGEIMRMEEIGGTVVVGVTLQQGAEVHISSYLR